MAGKRMAGAQAPVPSAASVLPCLWGARRFVTAQRRRMQVERSPRPRLPQPSACRFVVWTTTIGKWVRCSSAGRCRRPGPPSRRAVGHRLPVRAPLCPARQLRQGFISGRQFASAPLPVLLGRVRQSLFWFSRVPPSPVLLLLPAKISPVSSFLRICTHGNSIILPSCAICCAVSCASCV